MAKAKIIAREVKYRLYIRDRKKYLVGRDEGRLWMTQVSARSKSIAESLRWLNPCETHRWYRQGDLYFQPVLDERTIINLDEAEESGNAYDMDQTEYSTHEYSYTANDLHEYIGNTRHVAEHSIVLLKSGDAAFIGRRGSVKTHSYDARPRLFVRGRISHEGHHRDQIFLNWYEVLAQKGRELNIMAYMGD